MTKSQLLELIEVLARSDAAEEVEIDRSRWWPISKRERILARQLMTIYRFTHAYNLHACHSVHGDWIDEAEKAYEEMIEAEKPSK